MRDYYFGEKIYFQSRFLNPALLLDNRCWFDLSFCEKSVTKLKKVLKQSQSFCLASAQLLRFFTVCHVHAPTFGTSMWGPASGVYLSSHWCACVNCVCVCAWRYPESTSAVTKQNNRPPQQSSWASSLSRLLCELPVVFPLCGVVLHVSLHLCLRLLFQCFFPLKEKKILDPQNVW